MRVGVGGGGGEGGEGDHQQRHAPTPTLGSGLEERREETMEGGWPWRLTKCGADWDGATAGRRQAIP